MKLMKLNIQLFASKTKSITLKRSADSYEHKLTASFNETETSTENNTSTISVSATLEKAPGYFEVYNAGELKVYWFDNNDNSEGTLVQSITVSSTESKQIAEGNIIVNHKNDGSLKGYAKAVWQNNSSYSWVPYSGNVSTDNTKLTDIARAVSSVDDLTCSTSYLNGTLTYKYTPTVANYYYRAKFSISDGTEIKTVNLGTPGATTQQTNTLTFSSSELTNIYNNTTDAQTQIVVLIIETYSNSSYSKLIGSSSQKTKKLKIPTTVVPTASVSIEESISSISSQFEAYVQNKSKPKFTITATAPYNATITNYQIKVNGIQVYNGSPKAFTMSTVLTKTSNSYEIVVTDSRARTTTLTGTITALAYSNPQINKFSAERNKTTPTTIDVKFSASVSPVSNKNIKRFIIQYKLTSDTSWTTAMNYTGAYSYTNQTYSITGTDESTQYDVRLIVRDYFNTGTTVLSSKNVGTSFTLINFNSNGKTLAFGKASEINDAFECNMSEYIFTSNANALTLKRVNSTSGLRILFSNDNGNLGYIGMNVVDGGIIRWSAINNSNKYTILDTGNFLDFIYPKDSIYFSSNSNASPGTLFGGTWASITTGITGVYGWKRTT